ncbi:MAG TPA: response regulator [Acetobacteraceae bacterium]|jgi:two-component system, OmpR family, response regulator|nr:response regulator [Acetobacteraceae bacterium]
MQHVLVVEDDPDINEMISRLIQSHGYRVSCASDGRAADCALARGDVDLMLLDLMLPGDDGLSICRRVRAHSSVPILLVTALGSEVDRVSGLEVGADDYIVKPFSHRELLARVRAVLRRSALASMFIDNPPAIWSFDGWQLDLVRRTLRDSNGMLVALTSAELALLATFCTHAQRVLPRDRLLYLLHGRNLGPFDRSIDIQVSRLRRKIESDIHNPTLIQTVRSSGYIFTAKPRLYAQESPAVE